MSTERLRPSLGRFYLGNDGQVWCCYRVSRLVKDYGEHTQSWCVRVSDHQVQYFLDGQAFDEGGEAAVALVETVQETPCSVCDGARYESVPAIWPFLSDRIRCTGCGGTGRHGSPGRIG